tara:strand:+ start:37 stop:483 length:447 start_codon:yes stop_codon:yes gene_type:complete
MNEVIENIIQENLLPGQVLLDNKLEEAGSFIKVVIDSEKSISLGETTYLTRVLSDSESLGSLFPKGFSLEVSTPGILEPLKFPFQYRKNINRDIDIHYSDKGKDKKLTAKIIYADDSHVKLVKDNESFYLSYQNIKSAKIKLSFKKIV